MQQFINLAVNSFLGKYDIEMQVHYGLLGRETPLASFSNIEHTWRNLKHPSQKPHNIPGWMTYSYMSLPQVKTSLDSKT